MHVLGRSDNFLEIYRYLNIAHCCEPLSQFFAISHGRNKPKKRGEHCQVKVVAPPLQPALVNCGGSLEAHPEPQQLEF